MIANILSLIIDLKQISFFRATEHYLIKIIVTIKRNFNDLLITII